MSLIGNVGAAGAIDNTCIHFNAVQITKVHTLQPFFVIFFELSHATVNKHIPNLAYCSHFLKCDNTNHITEAQ